MSFLTRVKKCISTYRTHLSKTIWNFVKFDSPAAIKQANEAVKSALTYA